MKRRSTVTVMAMSAVVLAGCSTYSLEELRQTTPKGTPFQNALAKEYMVFAASEEKAYDWLDSWYFADKGLLAAYGKDTPPEDLAQWDIPAGVLPDLVKARAALVQVLASGAAQSQPQDAARAQLYFDCWVEQQEENWEANEIAQCRDGFKDSMEVLHGAPLMLGSAGESAPEPAAMPEERVAQPVILAPAEPMIAPEPAAAPAPVPAMDLSSSSSEAYIVFFEKGDVAITVSGEKVIGDVLNILHTGEQYDIVLNSHTDTIGSSIDNLKLTEERAQTVKQRLVAGGAKESSIKVFAFGESDTPVKTRDEVDEPANRRVEIFLSE